MEKMGLYRRFPSACERAAPFRGAPDTRVGGGEPAAFLMKDGDADALMQQHDELGEEPLSTRIANDLEFHHIIAVGSGNRESRAVFPDRRPVGLNPARGRATYSPIRESPALLTTTPPRATQGLTSHPA